MKTFETPMNQIERIYAYFDDPAHSAEIQMASDKTQQFIGTCTFQDGC